MMQAINPTSRPSYLKAAAFVAEARGWRLWLALFVLGASTVFAFAPFGVLPVYYVAFPLLVLSFGVGDNRLSWRAAFARGWWFAFGQHVAGLYWISNALLVFSADFLWMVPFAAVGLPAALAIFYGLAGIAVARLRAGLGRAIGIAVIWSLTEWIKGHVFTGFPWNLSGYAWAEIVGLDQSAALIGVYGMGVLALLSACLCALPLMNRLQDQPAFDRKSVVACVLGVALPIVLTGWGAIRLVQAPELAGDFSSETTAVEDQTESVGLRMVQGGIPQREKWGRAYQRRNFSLYLELSTRTRPDWVDHVIWPETTATFFMEQADAARAAIAAMLPADGLLLTGTLLRSPEGEGIHNGMAAVDQNGIVRGTYAKSHLVPFGEYVPLSEYLPLRAVGGVSGYVSGPGPRTVTLPGMPPVSPLICYEVVFPGAVTEAGGARPEWLLNLTNDAWYGYSIGPFQHLAQTRLRGIEEGLPILRAASTGVSAAFDAYGREIGRIGLGQAGVLDIRLPKPAEATFYGRFGDTMFFLFLVILGAAAIASSRVRL